MMTPENAHSAPCAGLRARIRGALDVSKLPKSQFVERQIARHLEFQSRQSEKCTAATRLQTALNRLDEIAQTEDWSQTRLAFQIGVKESTFRKIKAQRVDPRAWLGKLEAAVARLSTLDPRPSTQEVAA